MKRKLAKIFIGAALMSMVLVNPAYCEETGTESATEATVDASEDDAYQVTSTDVTIGDWIYRISNGKAYLKKYNGTAADVVLPGSVEYGGTTYAIHDVESGCMYGRNDIKKITIPASIDQLGGSAFSNCENLSEVVILGDIHSINRAFSGSGKYAESLKVTFGDDVTEIPQSLFGYDTFTAACHITDLVIGNNVKKIGAYSFYGCDLKTMSFGESLEEIGDGAFKNNQKLESVELKNPIHEIGCEAFGLCSGLKFITIDTDHVELTSYAFTSCANLKRISITGNVKIGKRAFAGSENLEYVKFDGEIESPYYDNVINVECPFDMAGKYSNNLTVEFGDNVKEIPTLFDTDRGKDGKNYANIKNINISKNVTKIKKDNFKTCYELRSVIFGGSAERWAEICEKEGNDVSNCHLVCEETRGAFNDHSYLFYNYQIPWNEAKEYCEKRGGSLVCIGSADENSYLYSTMKELNINKVNVGLYRDGSDWRWVNSSSLDYTNWADGKPDGEDAKKYGMLSGEISDGKWSNSDGEGCGFICEWSSARADDPSNPDKPGSVSSDYVILPDNVVSCNGVHYYMAKTKVPFSKLFVSANSVTSSSPVAKVNKKKNTVKFVKEGDAVLTADNGDSIKVKVFGKKAIKVKLSVGDEYKLPEDVIIETAGKPVINKPEKAELSMNGILVPKAKGTVKLQYTQFGKKRTIVSIKIKGKKGDSKEGSKGKSQGSPSWNKISSIVYVR